MGAVDRDGRLRVPVEFESIGDFQCGLAPAVKNGRYGYIDVDGRVVVPFVYDDACEFHGELARVRMGGFEYFVDNRGNNVAGPYHRAKDVSCGRGAFQRTLTSNWGFVDTFGRTAIQEKYSSVLPFSESVAAVSFPNGLFGFISETGETVIRPEYRNARSFSERLAAVSTSGEKFGFIDPNGRLVIPERFTGADLQFGDSLAPVWKAGQYGYIDRCGKLAISHRFYDARPFSGGLAIVGVEVRGERRFGFIAPSGEWVIHPEFSFVSPFRDGYSRVNSDPNMTDDSWEYIDTNGNYLSVDF